MAIAPETRHSLLLRLRRKTDDAWSEFLDLYEQAIVDYSRRRGLQDADARDVTQEVLTAVTSKVDQWREDPSHGTFRGWLFRVARNVAADKIKEQTRRPALERDVRSTDLIEPTIWCMEDESRAFWTAYRLRLIHWAAERVRPQVREASWNAFWLTTIEGRTSEAVAKNLGLSVGNVYASKFRIMNRIRILVTKLDDAGELEETLFREFSQHARHLT